MATLIEELNDLLLKIDQEATDDQLRQCFTMFAHWSFGVMKKLGEDGKRCAVCGENRPHIHWLDPQGQS